MMMMMLMMMKMMMPMSKIAVFTMEFWVARARQKSPHYGAVCTLL